MSRARIRVVLVPLRDRRDFETRTLLAAQDEPALTLRELLTQQPAMSTEAVEADVLDVPVARLNVVVAEAKTGTPYYWAIPPAAPTPVQPPPRGDAVPPSAGPPPPAMADSGPDGGHPRELTDAEAVRIAYREIATKAGAYLDAGLSVLIRCDKLLVENLARQITGHSGRTPRVVEAPPAAPDPAGIQPTRRQQALLALQQAVRTANPATDVVLVAHLDLLAGGADAALGAEARELTDVLYEPVTAPDGSRADDCVLLAFVDPSLVIPEVLANRFAVRLAVDTLPREVPTADGGTMPIGVALVTAGEAAVFAGFDPVGLYKHVAGMNAIRLRHAIRFAVHVHRGTGAPFGRLVEELRVFKAATSTRSFEVPNVRFDQIGGYADVRAEMRRALTLIAGTRDMSDELRSELAPRGFIFHGPPGTGKTLFAKAVATALEGTILVVSGPEVTDMYLGESERRVREIFAEARRNAPSVVVFDEFDAIAGRRTGHSDGGSRAGNAIVAQLLTEMDGFRGAVQVLVIGTTNRLDIIDNALLRPSRFRPVRIDLPDLEACRAIAEVHAGHFGIDVTPEVLDAIAQATLGMNGDEIRSIFRDLRADQVLGTAGGLSVPRHLGILVGRLRRTAQERDLAQTDTAPPAQRPVGATPHVLVAEGTSATADTVPTGVDT
jgi:transitional endoplasmic reticulum ATPase